MKHSKYVTIVITVPETHADLIREVLGQAGAGRVGNYTHCSFSVKGTGYFKPAKRANPFIGKENELECVVEERIETICGLDCLHEVLEAVKKAHPYEETMIDIFPIYEIAQKQTKK